jgi:hypothetical protein
MRSLAKVGRTERPESHKGGRKKRARLKVEAKG